MNYHPNIIVNDVSLEASSAVDEEARGEARFANEFFGRQDPLWWDFCEKYRNLDTFTEYEFHDERQCVQIPLNQHGLEIEFFLRKGVRCFMFDLFLGTINQNQKMLLYLRYTELKLSHEYGFAIQSKIIARISPRYQYTGNFLNFEESCELHTGQPITLTSNRKYSTMGSDQYIYVNAGHIMPQLQISDFIIINSIKLCVFDVRPLEVDCFVVRGGILRSRMQVFFPQRISNLQLSLEEYEDILFCKQMGIDVVISHACGNMTFLHDVKQAINDLGCAHMKLGACISLNAYDGCKEDLNWLIENMEIFLLLINPIAKGEILKLLPDMQYFINHAYGKLKPLILDFSELANGSYKVEPCNFNLFFLYPDRYLINRRNLFDCLNFHQLQGCIFDSLFKKQLQPFTNDQLVGSLSLARYIVYNSVTNHVPIILVAPMHASFAQQISHFRPKAQIVAILPSNTEGDDISMNWNITKLNYDFEESHSHEEILFKKIMYGLKYAQACKIINHSCFIIVAFSRLTNPNEYKNEFHLIQFNESDIFPRHLYNLLHQQ